MSFIESPRFPISVSWGSTAAPMYSTTVTVLRSGHEVRNSLWSYPLSRYNVAAGVRSERELYDLIEFFHAVKGRFHGFRFKDRWDYKSVFFRDPISSLDQTIGTGDGSTATFQLKKIYAKGTLQQTRLIRKPVQGTVMVAVGGVQKTEGVHYTVDYTTGIITFTAGNIPASGQSVTAGFEFDVPCRFDTDELPTALETYKAGSVTVTISEIRV